MFSFFSRSPAPAVRPLDLSAAPDCARIHETAFAHAWNAEEFERLLGLPTTIADGLFYVRTEALVGFVLSQVTLDEAEILSIVVDPDYRHHGFGRLLLKTHLATLSEAHVASLFLEVEDGNIAAQGLYAHLGFHEIGKRQGYYRKPDGSRATALILRRDLG